MLIAFQKRGIRFRGIKFMRRFCFDFVNIGVPKISISALLAYIVWFSMSEIRIPVEDYPLSYGNFL